MPRGDRSGPSSEGPRTGRGMGYCTGNEHPGFINQRSNWGGGFGRRFRGGQNYGRGAGFGFRHGFENYYQGGIANVSDKTMIENEIRILKDQMSALEERLANTKNK